MMSALSATCRGYAMWAYTHPPQSGSDPASRRSDEGARILTYLFDLINRPDFHVRIRWQPGMVVIWDNRGTQHYAVADYLPHRRVMHRVAVVTDRRTPVG